MTVVSPNSPLASKPQTEPTVITITLGATVLFLVALAIRAAYFHAEPITDELYHLLAAQSWLQDGSLSIADGVYDRASVFTKLVGIFYSVGGVEATRWFCMCIGSLLVALVFVWTARNAGIIEAAIAATALALMPGAIFLSQHIRFYGLHALCFWLASIWFFSLVVSPRRGKQLVAELAGLAAVFFFSVHLQVTTLVGASGLIVWAIVYRWQDISTRIRRTKFAGRLLSAGLVLLIVILVIAVQSGIVATLAETYFASAEWNSSDTPAYYHNLFNRQFGPLWALTPVIFIVAVLTRRESATFCVVVFTIAFLLHSFGGMRSERYLFYAMPFLVVVWAIALTDVGKRICSGIYELLRTGPASTLPDRVLHFLAVAAVAASALFLVISIPASELSAKMTLNRTQQLGGELQYWSRYKTNWSMLAQELRPVAAASEVVVVTQGLQALYYLGDFDVVLNATVFGDIAKGGAMSVRDPRTGRTVIADAASLRDLMACKASGLLIAHAGAWRNRTRVPAPVADLAESGMQRVDVPTAWGFHVFEWDSDGTNAAACHQPDVES